MTYGAIQMDGTIKNIRTQIINIFHHSLYKTIRHTLNFLLPVCRYPLASQYTPQAKQKHVLF